MATCDNVFQRTEKKYRVGVVQLAQVRRLLSAHMHPDAYGCSRVTSVYFDTPAHELIGRSMDKPLYKEKLRVRAYGDAAGTALFAAFGGAARHARRGGFEDVEVYVELKKKYAGIVYKRRFSCSLAAAQAYLGGATYSAACGAHPLRGGLSAAASDALDVQVSNEIAAMMRRCGPLEPSLCVECMRVAWEPEADADPAWADLRVTFDSNLLAAPFDATTECGGCGSTGDPAICPREGGAWFSVIPSDESIMELKSSSPLPIELAEALSRARVYPSSFSKCGAAWARLSKPAAKGGLCA